MKKKARIRLDRPAQHLIACKNPSICQRLDAWISTIYRIGYWISEVIHVYIYWKLDLAFYVLDLKWEISQAPPHRYKGDGMVTVGVWGWMALLSISEDQSIDVCATSENS